ncbi:MAG: TatD family hydrolase [Cellvibrionales bacterium]|nr:TatD family hydrolase [Cellvibrionales bacterium]
MIVDSHCHLDRLTLDNLDIPTLDQVVLEAKAADVSHMLCVGIDATNSPVVCDIAEQYDNVFASVGIHPCDVKTVILEEELNALANRPKVVAIGETGLDYYYSKEDMAAQKESLILHLNVAKSRQLPVIIHTRDAKEDTLAILEAHACRESVGVLHCFTEDLDMAERAIDLGFYISFSGIVTFKSAKELQQVAKTIPLDRMLVETDSPYLAPVPFRGKPNFPKHTRQVAEFIADLREISLDEVATTTTHNFFQLFNRASKA